MDSSKKESLPPAKPFAITKQMVWQAYQRVKKNDGAAGVDGQSLAEFESRLEDNLYKLWNRLASGSWFPPPVRAVELPKAGGGVRTLGVPTVADRVAQTVVVMALEPLVEPQFDRDSYGCRPGRSAHDAVAATRARCWRSDWVIDLDIKGFFDGLDHGLLLKAVRHHTTNPWILLYVQRWLIAPLQRQDGSLEERTRGTPQGGVISPLLANLFMHYAFDLWLRRTYPTLSFERYVDDVIVHVETLPQAETVLAAVRERLRECGLELHPEKTKIVYCRDDLRPGRHEHERFDFLGFTFRPRPAKNRRGKTFIGFSPAMSGQAARAIRAEVRRWRLAARWSARSAAELGRWLAPKVRGWTQYYGKFYPAALRPLLYYLKCVLMRWARRKYARLRGKVIRSSRWVEWLARRDSLFAWVLAAT